MNTILFVCSLIVCIIGVLTFISGLMTKSKEDGVLVEKINQALEGIEELKSDLKSVTNTEKSLELMVRSHEEQIHTLFKQMDSSTTILEALKAILEILKGQY